MGKHKVDLILVCVLEFILGRVKIEDEHGRIFQS